MSNAQRLPAAYFGFMRMVFFSLHIPSVSCYSIRKKEKKGAVITKDWNQAFHHISVKCMNKKVQIKTDQALIDFLSDPKTKGSLLLSDYVHQLYEEEIGRPLNITRDSLAIEILGHVYIASFAKMAETTKSAELQAAVQKIKNHTDVIDCGEKDIDSNRYVWDAVEKSGLKKLIYLMCGKKA